MYWNFNKNTWTLNCNTGISAKKYEEKLPKHTGKTLKERDFPLESPALLLQR